MAETTGLLNRRTSQAYHEFESRPLRAMQWDAGAALKSAAFPYRDGPDESSLSSVPAPIWKKGPPGPPALPLLPDSTRSARPPRGRANLVRTIIFPLQSILYGIFVNNPPLKKRKSEQKMELANRLLSAQNEIRGVIAISSPPREIVRFPLSFQRTKDLSSDCWQTLK